MSETVKDVLFIRRKDLRAQSKGCDSTNDGSTWRFLLVARHAATLGLWHAITRVGELPFLKGFSL